MEEQRSGSRSWNWMLGALLLVAAVQVACGNDAKPSPSASGGAGSGGAGGGGSGGTSSLGGSGGNGQGGSSAAGGASSSGGDTGRGGSGGVGGSSGGGAGGDGGASTGGSSATGGVSGGSTAGGAGGQGGSSVGGTGGSAPSTTPKACRITLDCGSADLVCDPSRGWCVQCWQKADCSNGQECVAYQCATITKCEKSGDCGAGKVCDSGRCVECIGDGDCSSQKCLQNVCRTRCESDKTCTPQNKLCSADLKICVECSADRACAAGSFCVGATGTCNPGVCRPGESMCDGTSILTCKSDGSGWGNQYNCPDASPCKAYGGVAGCGGPLPREDAGVLSADAIASDGSPGDGGTTDGSASDANASDGSSSDALLLPGDSSTVPGDGPVTCGADNAVPCSSLPKLTGSPLLDGKGDEYCEIPSFHLNASTAKIAGKVSSYNVTPPEDAAVKVAWSPDGLVLFADVVDSSVQTVNAKDPTQAVDKTYQGDSIEIFISSSDAVTGSTGADSNTLHVIIPADGPAVAVQTSGTTGTPTEWLSTQYKQSKTATGYAIEALLPWPGGSPESGTQVRFDIGLNSADSNCSGVDDMRDGQLLYYVGQVSNSTCPGSSEGPVPYCDDRTWCTTTLQ